MKPIPPESALNERHAMSPLPERPAGVLPGHWRLLHDPDAVERGGTCAAHQTEEVTAWADPDHT